MLELNSESDCNWIESEFATVDLNDERLTSRFITVAKRFYLDPQKTIIQACESKAATKGAYRLFSNDNFQAEEILTSHYSETAKRMAGHSVVLAIHDTSDLSLNGHKKTKNLGGLSRKHTDTDRCIFLHPTLAVSTEGLPLGLLSYKTTTRLEHNNEGRRKQTLKRHTKKVSERESVRWIEGLEETASNVDLNRHQIINIADRESDSYCFMASALQKGMSFVIRSKGDRNVKIANGKVKNIRDAFDSEIPAKVIELKVPKNQGQEERLIQASIHWISATIDIPSVTRQIDVLDGLISVPVSVILVREIGNSSHDAVEWLLITDRSVRDLKTCEQIIEWYKLRWSIEIFFKILKSGCKVETCRLGSFERLDKYIALMTIIAFRIYYLTKIARSQPNEKCISILSDMEWKTLFLRTNRSRAIPKEIPTVHEAVEMIAKLGGYLARKSDPPPGPILIWRGWAVLSEAVETLKILQGLS